MAKHGGYRDPGGKVKKSGPGKYSQRTDGVPSLDNPDIQYGDVQRLMEARRQNPLPQRTGEQVFGQQGPSQSVSGQSGGGAGGPLPESLFSSPTNRPAESITTGIDRRIPGPDDLKESVLTYLAEKYSNATAKKWLDELRGVSQGATVAPGGNLGQPAPSLGSGPDASVGSAGVGGAAPSDVLDSPTPTLDEPFSDSDLEEDAAEEEPLLG